MNYNIFDSEEEALQAQAYDYEKLKIQYQDNPFYLELTKTWAIPRQRVTDQKWVYLVCPFSDAVHTQEEYDPSWFEDLSNI